MCLATAFLLGFYSKTDGVHSVGIWVVSLFSSICSYCIIRTLIEHRSFHLVWYHSAWTVTAFAAGAVSGLCAHFAVNGEGVSKHICMNLLPALFVSQSIIQILRNPGRIADLAEILCLGLIVYLIINLKDSLKRRNLCSFSVLSLIMFVGFEVKNSAQYYNLTQNFA